MKDFHDLNEEEEEYKKIKIVFDKLFKIEPKI